MPNKSEGTLLGSTARVEKVGMRPRQREQHRRPLTVRVTGATTGCVPPGGRPWKNVASGDCSN
jgi:hypothetical protein